MTLGRRDIQVNGTIDALARNDGYPSLDQRIKEPENLSVRQARPCKCKRQREGGTLRSLSGIRSRP